MTYILVGWIAIAVMIVVLLITIPLVTDCVAWQARIRAQFLASSSATREKPAEDPTPKLSTSGGCIVKSVAHKWRGCFRRDSAERSCKDGGDEAACWTSGALVLRKLLFHFFCSFCWPDFMAQKIEWLIAKIGATN